MSFTLRSTSARRRAAAVGIAVASSLALASPAFAVKSNVYFSVSVFPSDYHWDGIGTPPPNASIGSYDAYYSVRPIDGATRPDYRVDHVRGGAILPDTSGPISVIPGDVIRLVNTQTGATIAQSAFNGQPGITSSVVGQPTFAGTNTSGATSVSATLQRRIRRNITGYDYWSGTPTNSVTNDFEDVSYGRLTNIGDTTFGGTFTTPILAGDYVTVSQNLDHIDGDVETFESFSVTAPVGVVPPRDSVPPKVTRFLLGTTSLTVSQFLKSGLNTFVTPDESSTITQTLSEIPKKPKKKSKKKVKPATIVASTTSSTKAPGETAATTLSASKAGKKFLKKLKKRGVKLNLTTVTTDAAGNSVTSTQVVKLKAG